MTNAQIKVLSVIYMATDCSNEVYDWATLHWKQRRIADEMPEHVTKCDGCIPVDGDGFTPNSYTEQTGYRLTRIGYEALTEYDAARYPVESRRFYSEESTNAH